MSEPIETLCCQCKHFKGVVDPIDDMDPEKIDWAKVEIRNIYYCKAFPLPDGIPSEILDEKEANHTQWIQGQKGKYVFEKKTS